MHTSKPIESRSLPISGLTLVQRFALKPLLMRAMASRACWISKVGAGRPATAPEPVAAAARLVSICVQTHLSLEPEMHWLEKDRLM